MYQNKKHKQEVIARGDGYIYIGSYHCGEKTIDGKHGKKKSYIRVKCPYCNKEYDIRLESFIKGNKSKCTYCCNKYENSFAYHIQVELGEPLNKYWDWEKNTVNPYLISKGNSNVKVNIKCSKTDYHKNYSITPCNFYNGRRCPYCSTRHGKVHPKDSFGALYPDKAKYWSKKNEKSPFEVTPKTHEKYWFICEKCGKEFSKDLSNLNQRNAGIVCKECKSSEGEKRIKNYLDKHNIKYIYDKPCFNDLKSNFGIYLRPDFILPNEKIWIEYDGIFHYEKQYDEDGYERLLLNDEIKNEYAKNNNWLMIRIPYWDFDNVESILSNILNL